MRYGTFAASGQDSFTDQLDLRMNEQVINMPVELAGLFFRQTSMPADAAGDTRAGTADIGIATRG